MKKILTVFLLFVCIQLAFSEEIIFKLKNDVYVTDGNVGSSEVFIRKDQFLELKGKKRFYKDSTKNTVTNLYLGKERYYFNLDDLELVQEHVKTPEELKNSYWIMSYYYDFLEKKDLTILFEHEKEWTEYSKNYDEANNKWNYYFQPLYLLFEEYFILGSYNLENGDINLLGKGISWENSKFEFQILCKYLPHFLQPEWISLNEMDDFSSVCFVLDGDYLLVYKDKVKKENLLYELAKADQNTLKQINNLVKNGNCSLSEINFPKHAAEKNKTNPILSGSSKSNVSPNKTMSVSENLKLRSGEATSTQVLTVMSAGTKVKILELGKAETIDGINSNWVKVEIISGNDRDGNKLKSGMAGWCYGGYLE